MFEFLSPVQIGTTTFDPEDDNLMSDKNLDDIGVTPQGAGVLGNDVAQKQDLARIAQKSAGIFGQGIGETLGTSYVGANIPNQSSMFGPSDVLDAGVNALLPFGETSDVEKAGLSYMKGGGRQEDGSYSFSDKLYGNQLKANLQTAGFVAGGNFVGQVIAGADPMDAAKDAAKTGVAYYIGNAIAGPTGGKVAAWISNLFG